MQDRNIGFIATVCCVFGLGVIVGGTLVHIKEREPANVRGCLITDTEGENLHDQMPWLKKGHYHGAFNNFKENLLAQEEWMAGIVITANDAPETTSDIPEKIKALIGQHAAIQNVTLTPTMIVVSYVSENVFGVLTCQYNPEKPGYANIAVNEVALLHGRWHP